MEHSSVDFHESTIKAALRDLPLGGLRVFQRIGSTNDEALKWASQGAADFSVVVTDEQTAGRGRSGRTWLTRAGTALALSVILRYGDAEAASGRLTGLGALAVVTACESLNLQPSIKWPNDVLLGGRKVAGILVEAQWSGERPEFSVIGIGINVLRGSTPPAEAVRFPATSLEDVLGHGPDRIEALRAVLGALLEWRPRLPTPKFLRTWEQLLAFRGDMVTLTGGAQPAITGRLLGLEDDGSLRLMTTQGKLSMKIGEIHLQPADDRML